jgi:hypothetical protein
VLETRRFGVLDLLVVVVVLIISLCDVAIVIEEVKIRRGSLI